jgi:hypothetical protein
MFLGKPEAVAANNLEIAGRESRESGRNMSRRTEPARTLCDISAMVTRYCSEQTSIRLFQGVTDANKNTSPILCVAPQYASSPRLHGTHPNNSGSRISVDKFRARCYILILFPWLVVFYGHNGWRWSALFRCFVAKQEIAVSVIGRE